MATTAVPAETFFQTFFSTDVVKFQNQDGNNNDTRGAVSTPNEDFYASFSQLALLRWLQVTLPLSILTLGIGYLAFKMTDKKRKRESLPFYSKGSKTGLS
jgi:hypothetical protein